MFYMPSVLRECGFNSASDVRGVAKKFGRIVSPMHRDDDLLKKLAEIDAPVPVEF